MRIELVGGMMDGQRVDIRDEQAREYWVAQRPVLTPLFDDRAVELQMERFTYKRRGYSHFFDFVPPSKVA